MTNNVIAMGLGLAGGCTFPPEQLPAFVREYITPFTPTYWFAQAVRGLQVPSGTEPWTWALFKLTLLGFLLVVAASWYFQKRLEAGARG